MEARRPDKAKVKRQKAKTGIADSDAPLLFHFAFLKKKRERKV
jgi:hypothetical protein